MTNVIKMLKTDHKKVKKLFKDYEGLGDNAKQKKMSVAQSIFRELTIHIKIEEDHLYPFAEEQANHDGKKLVAEAEEEHDVAKKLLRELAEMDPGSLRFDAKMKVLMENVNHHIKEEETSFFPNIEKKLKSDDSAMYLEMEEEKIALEERFPANTNTTLKTKSAPITIFRKMWMSVFMAVLLIGSNMACDSSSILTSDANLSDSTAPMVTVTNPEDDATNVPFNRLITASFSEQMNASSINEFSFTLSDPLGSIVAGSVGIDATNRIATFTPSGTLNASALYTATITTEAEDSAENPLDDNYVWNFSTGAVSDVIAPLIDLTAPVDFATDVTINTSVNASFSEAINSNTITSDTFVLTAPDTSVVSGSIVYDTENNIVTFVPSTNLQSNTTYTAVLTMEIEDLSGIALAADYIWQFTTGTSLSETAIDLGSNTFFAILAGSTVTSTGQTIINGDLGVSPGTAVTGFPPAIINGSIHAGDSAAAQALLDLTDAYNDAASRTTNSVTISGNLGGMTLTPGLYQSTSSLEITSGDLTLNAQGDANAIFIFQMASTLTTTSDRQVILSGGAKTTNIYWQVGSSATLGTNSVFKGNIMADQSITLTTGAELEGRALTRIGAINLDTNVVTIPAQ